MSLGLLLVMSSACSDKKNPVNNPAPNTGGPARSVFLEFSQHFLDLDSGAIDTTVGGSPFASADIQIRFAGGPGVNSVLSQETGRSISRLVGKTFSEVTVAQADSATFSRTLLIAPFDSTSTFLIKTDLGSVYKLGNASETSLGATFDYALMSVAP
jgi:hypothetical protein